MTLAIRMEQLAKKELRQARCWHEAEASGRGKALVDAVNLQLRELAARPFMWPLVGKKARQSPLPGWDYYTIIYEVHDDHILVLSVFHASREPKDY